MRTDGPRLEIRWYVRVEDTRAVPHAFIFAAERGQAFFPAAPWSFCGLADLRHGDPVPGRNGRCANCRERLAKEGR